MSFELVCHTVRTCYLKQSPNGGERMQQSPELLISSHKAYLYHWMSLLLEMTRSVDPEYELKGREPTKV